jgi:hypothetical protein
MFDSFHHVPDPKAFVTRLARLSETVFLIEPSGNAIGQWTPQIDLDWIVADLDNVRRHAEHQLGVHSLRSSSGAISAAGALCGEAIERRYPIAEYERLFEGYGLSVQGTLAGFQQYPPDAFAEGPLKEHFGRFLYETIVQLERDYIHGKRDLHAKHWAILARRGERSQLPSFTAPPDGDHVTKAVKGPWDVAYLGYEGPHDGLAGERVRATLTLRNESWRAWSSSGNTPIHASYHWSSSDRPIVKDGLRTGLGQDLGPGEQRSLTIDIELPSSAGPWELQIDLVEEHVTWFSEQGQQPLVIGFAVRR